MKITLLLIAPLISLAACNATIVPISGTPTAEQVLSNARRVASELDSYRSRVTVIETTRYPQSPKLDSAESKVHILEIGSAREFRMDLSWGLEMVQIDGTIYSRMPSEDWVIAPLQTEDSNVFPGESGATTPGGHPESWLDSRRLIDTSLNGQFDLGGRSVYLIEGLVPMVPRSLGTHRLILSDNARIYVDTNSFEVIRVEVDRNIEDSHREDSGYQVIPGVVEIETLEIFDYSEHNAEIEIVAPLAKSPI